MKTQIRELIKHYQREIGLIQKAMTKRRIDGDIDVVHLARLSAKRGTYNQMVHDLQKLLENEDKE